MPHIWAKGINVSPGMGANKACACICWDSEMRYSWDVWERLTKKTGGVIVSSFISGRLDVRHRYIIWNFLPTMSLI